MGGNQTKNTDVGSTNHSQPVQTGREEGEIQEFQQEEPQQQIRQRQKSLLKQVTMTKLNAYERIEAQLPLQVIDIREFEGRVKKLVYGKETVSLRQLQYMFSRDYEDFDGLMNEDSLLYKIMTSDFFKVDSDEINIQYLMLFGVLYCQGSNDEKSKVFYDILQDGLQEVISANDKDLKTCFGKMISLPSVVMHQWAIDYGNEEINQGEKQEIFENSKDNEELLQTAIEEIKSAFLDDVFDISSKIPREQFIKECAKKQNYLFKPKEIRKKLIETLKNLQN